MSEQEELVQYLKAEYGGIKLPHVANHLRIGHHGPYATLDTGTWDGQITLVGVRFHDGEYEVRDYQNNVRQYKTSERMKEALTTFLESVKEDQLERAVRDSINRPRR